jgi:hypothetical protein
VKDSNSTAFENSHTLGKWFFKELYRLKDLATSAKVEDQSRIYG